MIVEDLDKKLHLWKNFCLEYVNPKLGIPLFEVNNEDLVVNTKGYGKDARVLLKRSISMEALVIDEVNKVLIDFSRGGEIYEGLIYMMYWLENEQIIPLYIGKSEKYGKQGNNLSANIASIASNKGFFCRWGDNYAYHIGDLSAIVCPGHLLSKQNQKYRKWASRLFNSYPSNHPQLRKETYFWIHAWEKDKVGIWIEYGHSPLTALEYHLISVASVAFSDVLLNEEGVNRRVKDDNS
ncbi:GIY-YIG homing endonuclease [Tumidithrix helvetica PCC 7403]|uniref:hypothetical protein n=1 Tax=Tumidithrix helvetica TaxID=3457545 RepID=UPI003C835188